MPPSRPSPSSVASLAADWSHVANLPSNRTNYTDTGVVSGTSYEYRLSATNVYGTTPFSSTASATASAAPGPYTTFPGDIPGTIQTEDYDIGGGIDTTTGNLAGQ